MLQVSNIKLSPGYTEEQLKKKILNVLRTDDSSLKDFMIIKESLDARKKDQIHYLISVACICKNENAVLKKCKSPDVKVYQPVKYIFPVTGTRSLTHRPVIIGMGPAGMFAGLYLARHGYRPLILERGSKVEERTCDVEKFWQEKKLDPESNIVFGEGGAGTFSDGKLNTMVHDKVGRGRAVLKDFADAGADASITYAAKPHVGTDVLKEVVTNIRKEIIALGGEVRFNTRADDFIIKDGHIAAVKTAAGDVIDTELVILAPGHSARDVFYKLKEIGADMESKAFAVGFRTEHLQKTINVAQYGEGSADKLPAADYKLTYHSSNGRGVYSFCMCPGGYVVNASSEPGRLLVNGMSYHARDAVNSNSAIIVTVTPEDFGHELFDGLKFQEMLEEKAFKLANGAIPSQRYEDYCKGKRTTAWGKIKPCHKGETDFANLRGLLPTSLEEAFMEAMPAFARSIRGFDDPDTILSAIESRTSSPVRIVRDESLQSSIKGLIPCGEGAGYAGGITSAAIDGIKAAEAVAAEYAPFISRSFDLNIKKEV